VSKLARGPDGALYGTTNLGGANGKGAAYRLAPPASAGGSWSETVIYSFLGGSDGDLPSGGVLFDRRGRLYGTATSGGNQICVDNGGWGTVLRLIPPPSGSGTWSEQTLCEFSGADDGAVPQGDLIFGKGGSPYGTTSNCGSVSLTCPGDCGTVFQLTPPASAGGQWTETTLYFFVTAGDGHGPEAGLIRNAGGTLYGVTAVAGNFVEGGVGGGTVFEILP
jgi:uncharacterized repeat protein (TIGR03803 family)